jgi:hypothetical protein
MERTARATAKLKRTMFHRFPTCLVAGALLAGAVSAQIQKGQLPPPIPFKKVWNDGPASFDDFAGKVVILKFSESW